MGPRWLGAEVTRERGCSGAEVSEFPTKFQAICIGKNAHENIASFKVDSVEIKCEENVTLLGVNIDFMLSFDDHVTDLGKKASKQLAVLKRLGRFLTKQGKLTIYNSFIVSNFNYCPLAWHFWSMSSTNKMEKVQERALRFINNDFTSSLQDPSRSLVFHKYCPFACKEDETNGYWSFLKLWMVCLLSISKI